MSFQDELAAIETRLKTNWTTTPIKFENVPFTEPTTAYVALNVVVGEGLQISLGATNVLRRWPGIIMMRVFAPENTGTKVVRQYADSLGAIFDRVQFSSGNSGVISCRIPSIETVGLQSGWWQINVSVPYRRTRQY